MSALHDIVGTIAFVATIGAGCALADNVGEYVAPTPKAIEADKSAQLAQLCRMDWPAGHEKAKRRACGPRVRP